MPAPDEPMVSGEPLLPGEGEPPTSDQAAAPAGGELPASGQPPAPALPPFNGPESGSCLALPDFVADTPLDDTRGTGFFAHDMLSIFNEQGPATLTWHDGTTTTLGIVARPAGGTSVVDDPPPGEGYCVPFRPIPIRLGIESADGRLAE